jgi:hypothetical protein
VREKGTSTREMPALDLELEIDSDDASRAFRAAVKKLR